MSKEAIRSRARRDAAKRAALGPPDKIVKPDGAAEQFTTPEPSPAPAPEPAGDKFTAAHLQLMPDGPSRSTPSGDQLDKAVRNWTMIVRACGFIASKIFKGDELKVPDADAKDCAEAILDGWPELALASDADFKKIMAAVVVGSVGSQRWELYAAAKKRPAAVAASSSTDGPSRPTAAGDGSSLTLLSL